MKVFIGKFPKNINKERKIRIHIDEYDAWNADETLAMIIAPVLKKLKEIQHGAPFVDDEDVPAGLGIRRSETKEETDNSEHTHDNHFRRWEWVLNEMIWTFEEIANGKDHSRFYDHSGVDSTKDINTQIRQIKVDEEGLKAYCARIENGLRLFGKYYLNLWD